MNNAKRACSLVILLPYFLSATTVARGEQPGPSSVASGDSRGITRTIDASKYFRPFPDLVAYRNTSIQKAPAPVLAELSEREFGKARITRCWLNLDEMWDYRTRQYNYNYQIGVHKYDDVPEKHQETWGSVSETRVHFHDYLRAFGEHSDTVMLTIRRYERDILDGKLGVTMEDWKTIFKHAVKHYREVCPKLRYIEVCNEYALQSFIGCTAEEYYQFYQLAYQAVNEANAELGLNGKDRLLVGGPVVTGTGRTLIKKLDLFCQNFSQDDGPNKRLDFVSWHEYHNDYAATAHRERLVRGLLGNHGLPKDLPLFITEHDPYHPKAGSREYNLINGAGLVKSLYFTNVYSPGIKIMPWVQYHIAEIQTRFMWFDGPNEPETRAEQLRMLPSGCCMKFLSMHKDWEIAVDNAIANDNLVLASVQNDGLIVQAVNYGKAQNVRLRIEKIPEVFSALGEAKVRIVKYLIDQDHSNCVADPEYSGGIEKIEDFWRAPDGGSITLTHPGLSKNGIVLWQLIPATSGAVLNAPVSLAFPAPEPKQPPFDPAKALDTAMAVSDASIQRNGSTLLVHVVPSQGRPGVTFRPPVGGWDLTALGHIEARVKNVGKRPLKVHLAVDNPDADRSGRKGCCIASETIPPGMEKTLRIVFRGGSATDIEAMLRELRASPGTLENGQSGHVDPTNIVRVSVYVYRPDTDCQYEVSGLRGDEIAEVPLPIPSDNVRAGEDGQPNILFIVTDQQFAAAMSCAGSPYVKTPAIDSLAKRGMMFTEAYATSPVCSPSRGSMLTGLFPHQHGVTENGKRIKAELKEICIEHLLTAKGYECVYAGKWHLAASRTINQVGLKQHPYRVIADSNDARVSNACVEYFGEKHDRPFFLVASYVNPHDICLWAMGQQDGHQRYPVPEISLEQCPPLPGNFGVPEDEPTVLREYYMTRHAEHKSFNDEKWRRYLHAYYWMVATVDAEIGKMLDALRSNGLEENTLIVFTSDHGDGLAAHQWLGKCCHYEEAMRVPLIVSFPGVIESGRVDRTHLISNGPDFYATALDYAGVAIPNGCQGKSLRGLLEGTNSFGVWRDQVVSEIWIPGSADPTPGNPWKSAWGRMLRTARFKYTIYDRGSHREQLHDLQNDRLEMHNLATDPNYREALNEHRRRLADWCKETEDVKATSFLVSP